MSPGKGWFRRFLVENEDIRFLRKRQEAKYQNEQIPQDMWARDNRRYLTENSDGYLCFSANSIFVVEAQRLVWKGAQNLSFIVVVRYDFTFNVQNCIETKTGFYQVWFVFV